MYIKTQNNSIVNSSRAYGLRKEGCSIVCNFGADEQSDIGFFETEARTEEIMGEIYNAIARGDQVYTMPEE